MNGMTGELHLMFLGKFSGFVTWDIKADMMGCSLIVRATWAVDRKVERRYTFLELAKMSPNIEDVLKADMERAGVPLRKEEVCFSQKRI